MRHDVQPHSEQGLFSISYWKYQACKVMIKFTCSRQAHSISNEMVFGKNHCKKQIMSCSWCHLSAGDRNSRIRIRKRRSEVYPTRCNGSGDRIIDRKHLALATSHVHLPVAVINFQSLVVFCVCTCVL